jgi:hypothetical protein
MKHFVNEDSIVRKIWGKGDTILFIFAGASAEFALNKAVDWLYFTGRLPADPLARLFSTVSYARMIVFSDFEAAHKAIDKMSAIHSEVESTRGSRIPDWAYRDVLFMLIDYSIRSFEVLERKLSVAEKAEVFDVFHRVGNRMGLKHLPDNYLSWLVQRNEHLRQNLEKSHYTADLYKQYRKHLGLMRYLLLKEAQILVTPRKVIQLLSFRKYSLLIPLLQLYKLSRKFRIDTLLKNLILPRNYKNEIRELDQVF